MQFSSIASVLARKPTSTLLVPPSVFRDDWDARPKEDTCCGVRSLGLEDVSDIRKMASETAEKLYSDTSSDEYVETYNDAVMSLVVARSTCDPNNVAEPWEIWQGMPDDMAPVALSVDGARWLWGQVERLRIETCVTLPEATDEMIEDLPDLFVAALVDIDEVQEKRVRRFAQFIADELAEIIAKRKRAEV